MSTGERTLGYLTKTTVAARFVCVAYALLFLPVQLCIHFIDSSDFRRFRSSPLSRSPTLFSLRSHIGAADCMTVVPPKRGIGIK